MKIDPKIPANSELQSGLVKNATQAGTPAQPSAARTAGASPTQGEDTVQLSGQHGEVAALSAQVAGLPEVRTQKVAPLQAKVVRGTYKPDSQKIADAMLSDQSRAASKS